MLLTEGVEKNIFGCSSNEAAWNVMPVCRYFILGFVVASVVQNVFDLTLPDCPNQKRMWPFHTSMMCGIVVSICIANRYVARPFEARFAAAVHATGVVKMAELSAEMKAFRDMGLRNFGTMVFSGMIGAMLGTTLRLF